MRRRDGGLIVPRQDNLAPFVYVAILTVCCGDVNVAVDRLSPFRDYKTLLLNSNDDRQSLELLMKQLETGE